MAACHSPPSSAPYSSKARKADIDPPRTLAARLTRFTFYLPPSTSSAAAQPTLDTAPSIKEIQRELPRTVGIYKLKGLVGKMFGLRPMGLRLVWETDEWDPVPGLEDDDNWGVSDEEEDEKVGTLFTALMRVLRLIAEMNCTRIYMIARRFSRE